MNCGGIIAVDATIPAISLVSTSTGPAPALCPILLIVDQDETLTYREITGHMALEYKVKDAKPPPPLQLLGIDVATYY